ncbi:MAG TPA: response regulator [Actinomycetota bacterium]|nr:response regulator [Actinomycetota bacterium]
MRTSANARSAIVADDRPLMRDLLRFALDELGFVTATQVSTGAAAIDAAAEHHPDVLILHEGTGLGVPDVIERIRSVSPGSTVVVLTTDRAETSAAVAASADAVVEEGAGLQDLPSVLGAATVAPTHGRVRRRWPVHGRTGPHAERWLKRMQGAVVATILLVGLMLVFPASGFDGGMAAAQESLVQLENELPDATPEEAVSLATTLVSQRAILLSRDVDVRGLDAQIVERLGPMIPSLSPDVARGLTGVLGPILTVQTLPSLTPAPPPTETPGPSETPTPEPTPTTSPTPGDTTTPSPSDTPSTDPSDTPSTDPSGSPSPPVEVSPPGDSASPSPG